MKKLSTAITESFSVNEGKDEQWMKDFAKANDSKALSMLAKKYSSDEIMGEDFYPGLGKAYEAANDKLNKLIDAKLLVVIDADDFVFGISEKGSKSVKENVNEAKFEGITIGNTIDESDFMTKITTIKTLDKGDTIIIHEPGMNEWMGNVEFGGIKGKTVKLTFKHGPEKQDMSMSLDEFNDEIKQGMVYRQAGA